MSDANVFVESTIVTDEETGDAITLKTDHVYKITSSYLVVDDAGSLAVHYVVDKGESVA